jgi:MoxR-like ATPase
VSTPPVRIEGLATEAALVRAALATGRHLLLDGPAGVGKSLLVTHICRERRRDMVAVNAAATMSGAALLGHHDPAQVLRAGYARSAFVPGPLVRAMRRGAVLYLDEANRLSPDAYNVLLSAMGEGTIAIARSGSVMASPGFQVVAAANLDDQIGTLRPPAAFLDRVVRIRVRYPDRPDETSIVRAQEGGSDTLVRHAVDAVRATRRHPDLVRGSSVRGALDLVAVAGALEAIPDSPERDQRLAAVLALSAKVGLAAHADRPVEAVIDEIWTEVLLGESRAEPGGGTAPWSDSVLTREQDQPGRRGVVPGSASDSTPPGTDPEDGGAAPEGAGSRGGHPPAGWASLVADISAETFTAISDFVAASGSKKERSALRGPLDPRDVQRLAARIVLRKVRGTRSPGLPAGRTAPVRYNFRSDDLDIDRTVAELLENPVPRHSDIWVHDRVPRHLGVVLLLDVSGSMRGEQLMRAAIAAAAAAVALAGHDELAVVGFGQEPVLLRPAGPGGQQIAVDRLIDDVLSMRPYGRTDIAAALEAGLTQLAGMRSPARLGIALTDGVHNAGADPVPIAARYPQLNVLATTESCWRLEHCRALAAAGHGRIEQATDVDRLPSALSMLLAE